MIDWTNTISEHDLRKLLPPEVRALLELVDKAGGNIESVGFALASPLPHLGSIRLRKAVIDFWPKVKREMYILICKSESKYSDLRKELSKGATTARDVLVTAIAAAISKELGFGPALLTPFIVLCLITVVRVGKEAWCYSFRQCENARDC